MKHIHIRNEQVEDLLCYKWLDVAEAIESAFVDETADMIPKTYLDGWGRLQSHASSIGRLYGC